MQTLFCVFQQIDDKICECIYCKNKLPKHILYSIPKPTCSALCKKYGIQKRGNITPIDINPNNASSNPRRVTAPILKSTNKETTIDSGPGTELKKLLKLIGINASPNCKCNSRAKIMDMWGCDVCETKLDEIVGWLKEEAQKRNLPFIETAARILIKRAIKNARKKLKPSP